MTTTLIVPGYKGSPAPHWQDWWAAQDPDAVLVDQTDWDHPDPAAWELRLGLALAAHPGAWIVAHSLGAVLTARVATHWPQLGIGGALLVAPADVEAPELSARLGHFGPIPTAPLPFASAVVASRNDPCISPARAVQLARAWGSSFIDYGYTGHINIDSGFGPWPHGLALLRRMQAQDHRAALASLASGRASGQGGWQVAARSA